MAAHLLAAAGGLLPGQTLFKQLVAVSAAGAAVVPDAAGGGDGQLALAPVAPAGHLDLQVTGGVAVGGAVALILHDVIVHLLVIDLLEDGLQVVQIVNVPVPAAGALGNAAQGAGLHRVAHADDVHRGLLGVGIADQLVRGVAAAVIHAVGEGDDAAGAALEGGVGHAVVHRVVEGGEAVGGHIVDAVDQQAHVAGIVAHLLHDGVKGQHLRPVAQGEVQLLHKFGHDGLDLAHVGFGDAVALVGHQIDLQAVVALQREHRLDLPGQVFAAFHPFHDAEGVGVQTLYRLAAVVVQNLEVGPDHRILADVGGHQPQPGGHEVGGVILPVHLEGDAVHPEGEHRLAVLLAILGVKGQIGDLHLTVLLGHFLHLTALAVLLHAHLGQVQGEGLIAVQLQGDHREVVGVHVVHLLGEHTQGVQLLGQGVLLILLPNAPRLQQPGGSRPVFHGQIGLRQGQPVGGLQTPESLGLLIVVHRLGVAALIQGAAALLHRLLIGLVGADVPVEQKAADAHHQGRHNDDRQQPLLFASLGGGGLAVLRPVGAGNELRPLRGRWGGGAFPIGGRLRRRDGRFRPSGFFHRSGLRRRLLRCRRGLLRGRWSLLPGHGFHGLLQGSAAVPAELLRSLQLGAASITKHTHLPLLSHVARGCSTDVSFSLPI